MAKLPTGTGPVVYTPLPLLEPDQRVVEETLGRFILDREGADPAYNKLTKSNNGQVLNTDVARELSPVYGDVDNRLRHTASTTAPARAYVLDRLVRELQTARTGDTPKTLVVSAGSPGSGKSTVMATIYLRDQPTLIWDTPLRDLPLALAAFQLAHQNNWETVVFYVHRPFRETCDAIVQRCLLDGRPVTLMEAINDRMGVQQTITVLITLLYSGQLPQSVKITAFFNTVVLKASDELSLSQLLADPELGYTRKELRRIAWDFIEDPEKIEQDFINDCGQRAQDFFKNAVNRVKFQGVLNYVNDL
jgi:hypothetical protein